ncbi:MAG: glycosyltransferase [Candidatus Eremiobacteraeota bacterium]|nr:glycosyltransferase [Candidatus Eremiobacteraeota bacterium]
MRFLPESVKEKLTGKKYDMVLGIPSYQNDDTIGFVCRQLIEGTKEHFPDRSVLILNSDGSADDRTLATFEDTMRGSGIDHIAFHYEGIPGKGSAVGAIFESIQAVDASCGIMVDGDLRSISSAWLRYLVGPIISGDYDFITPYYNRHKFDGTITNSTVYPMTSAVYGVEIRQPIGGDFGFSRACVDEYLGAPAWSDSVSRFGIDIFMTTIAIATGKKIGQARLGAKVHDPKDPSESLGPMFSQVLGAMFDLYNEFGKRKSEKIIRAPVFGEIPEIKAEPVSVNFDGLKEQFAPVFKQRINEYYNILSSRVIGKLSKPEIRESGIPCDLWAKILKSFAEKYTDYRESPDIFMNMLVPLYYGRLLSLLAQLEKLDDDEAEACIRDQIRVFRNNF